MRGLHNQPQTAGNRCFLACHQVPRQAESASTMLWMVQRPPAALRTTEFGQVAVQQTRNWPWTSCDCDRDRWTASAPGIPSCDSRVELWACGSCGCFGHMPRDARPTDARPCDKKSTSSMDAARWALQCRLSGLLLPLQAPQAVGTRVQVAGHSLGSGN